VTIEKSIGWAEATWNPATGCTRGCAYCYAREMHHRFEKTWGYDFTPQLHHERLKQPFQWRKPRIVFTCSMGELFELSEDKVRAILSVCEANPQHRFLILTKRAEMLRHYYYPRNVWLGVTVTEAGEEYRIKHLVAETNARVKFVSFEPLQGPPSRWLNLEGIRWVIIGGRRRVSYPRHIPAFKPPAEWVETIIEEARCVGAAVFTKDNLGYRQVIREWPEEVARK